MKPPYKFTPPPPGWLDRFPDGDYTVGRGADPRTAEERARDPDGSLARAELERRAEAPTSIVDEDAPHTTGARTPSAAE